MSTRSVEFYKSWVISGRVVPADVLDKILDLALSEESLRNAILKNRYDLSNEQFRCLALVNMPSEQTLKLILSRADLDSELLSELFDLCENNPSHLRQFWVSGTVSFNAYVQSKFFQLVDIDLDLFIKATKGEFSSRANQIVIWPMLVDALNKIAQHRSPYAAQELANSLGKNMEISYLAHYMKQGISNPLFGSWATFAEGVDDIDRVQHVKAISQLPSIAAAGSPFAVLDPFFEQWVNQMLLSAQDPHMLREEIVKAFSVFDVEVPLVPRKSSSKPSRHERLERTLPTGSLFSSFKVSELLPLFLSTNNLEKVCDSIVTRQYTTKEFNELVRVLFEVMRRRSDDYDVLVQCLCKLFEVNPRSIYHLESDMLYPANKLNWPMALLNHLPESERLHAIVLCGWDRYPEQSRHKALVYGLQSPYFQSETQSMLGKLPTAAQKEIFLGLPLAHFPGCVSKISNSVDIFALFGLNLSQVEVFMSLLDSPVANQLTLQQALDTVRGSLT